jgi:O-methyltransferase domain
MLPNARSVSNAMHLLRLTDGLIAHLAVCAAARFGIADVLSEGPCHSGEIASRLMLNEQAVFRTLRYLSGHGVFEQTAPCVFANNELSSCLRSDVPSSVRSMLAFRGSPRFLGPLMDLPNAMCSGEPAHIGFDDLDEHPAERRLFDDAMTEVSAIWAPFVVSAYDFSACRKLMDLGGGSGFLLASILRACPALQGVLVDLPAALDRARTRTFWDGVADRVRFEAGDFFESVPGGCDACLMKNVLHDWDDARARQILLNCRRAIPDDGLLVLVEYSLGVENTPSLGKTLDVMMMTSFGGKERAVEEHRELLASAGFVLTNIRPLPNDVMILEARPSGATSSAN